MANLNYSLCIICQQHVSFWELKCPRNALGATEEDTIKVFQTLLDRLKELRDFDLPLGNECKVPAHITAKTLFDNFAKWHKSCKLKYQENKVRKLIDDEKKKREASQTNPEQPPASRTRQGEPTFDKMKCIFCQEETNDRLFNVTLLEFGKKMLEIAIIIKDPKLQARFGDGDLVALEGKYHHACLTKFYTRHRTKVRAKRKKEKIDEGINEERVIWELVESISDQAKEGKTIFPLSRLVRDAQTRREELGLTTKINATRFKEQILQEFDGDLIEHGQGYERKNLIFSEGLNTIVKDALDERKYEADVRSIYKVAKLIRKDMFAHEGFHFKGGFDIKSQIDSIPSSLKTLISMLLIGPSLHDNDSQRALSICQLIYLNS